MEKNKKIEIKTNNKYFDMIKKGIKPYLFLRKTNLSENDKDLFVVNNLTGEKLAFDILAISELNMETWPSVFAGISKDFTKLLKDDKTKNFMKRYFKEDKLKKIKHKEDIDNGRIERGLEPIYEKNIMEQYIKVSRPDKWLTDIGYKNKNPQKFILVIKNKEN